MSKYDFQDRIVIVTGASSGFGLAIARAFFEAGALIGMVARNPERLAQACAAISAAKNERVLPVACDVSSPSAVQDAVNAIVGRLGQVDILVNNAGSGLIAPFDHVVVEDALSLFQTNFFGAVHFTQAVLPQMKLRRSGQIINMASVAGLRGIPNSSMYCASKAALIAFSDSVRIELKPFGITVTTICPSRTNDTPFVAKAKKYGPVELYKVPENLTTGMVVESVMNAAAKRKRMVVIPFHARLMHTVNKFAPRLMDAYLYKCMPKLPSQKQECAL